MHFKNIDTHYLSKTVLTLAFYSFFILHAFGQDEYFPFLLGQSNSNSVNINNPIGINFQDVKHSVGWFLNKDMDDTCTCTLLNNSSQDGAIYVSTAAHCLETQKLGSLYDAWFSFDYEMGDELARGNQTVDAKISGVYKAKYEILFVDPDSDLALLKLKKYNSQLVKFAYALGWDNSITESTDSNLSNLSHPGGDHKKVFINPSSISLQLKSGVELPKGIIKKGYFYTTGNLWNTKEITIERGGSGSGLITKKRVLTAVASTARSGISNTFSAISNKWYGLSTESYFAKYLDSNNSWLNSIPGGYINDLVSSANENFELNMKPNETIATPSTVTDNPTELDKNVLWIRPSVLFDFFDKKNNLTIQNGYPIWLDLLGIKAENVSNSDLVLSVYYLDKNSQSRIYEEKLIYGVHVNKNSVIREPIEFGFKGDSWDCDNPPIGYPTCNRFYGGFPFGIGRSNEFKSEYLKAIINPENTEFESLLDSKIPIKVRLDNIGSDNVKVQAVSYPGDVPKNALQLFKPNEVLVKFKSYKYPESRRENSENLHISSLQVSQGDYNKSITTGNNGGYLNLVNPNFKIGPIKTSTISELNKTLSFNIALHNPNSVAYSYSNIFF